MLWQGENGLWYGMCQCELILPFDTENEAADFVENHCGGPPNELVPVGAPTPPDHNLYVEEL